MERPDYSFDRIPDAGQLRQTAVRAMGDMLSVHWHPAKRFVYMKEGAISKKLFQYDAGVSYAGLPYANGDAGLMQWMQFYDPETETLYPEGNGEWINQTLGNSCACCVMWSWSTVCNSLGGNFTTRTMTPAYGVYPVGIACDPELRDFADLPTGRICEENGPEKMYKAYSQILAGYGLVSTPQDGHAIMAIEDAHVAYLPDGTIDPQKSYVAIHDQRGGKGKGFYTHIENGHQVEYSGRTYYKYSFQDLLSDRYIPCAPAELMGKKAYDIPAASCTENGVAALEKGVLLANYPICAIRVLLAREGEPEKTVCLRILNKREIRLGIAGSYPISQLELPLSELLTGEDAYRLKITVTLSTGSVFTPVELTVKRSETAHISRFQVPSPMKRPVYTLEETATEAQMRQTAVNAFGDFLRIPWQPRWEIRYYKQSGARSDKLFHFVPGTLYAGLPYTNAASGLLQWFDRYDEKTGKLLYDSYQNSITNALSGSCASSVMWGWSSVCPSLQSNYSTYSMVRKNGVDPVPPCTYPETVEDFRDYPTRQICLENGKQTMFDAYLHIRMGDALVSTLDKHAIMAAEDARPAYREDGSLDPDKSVIVLRDQRAGKGDGFYEKEVDGVIHRFTGRLRHEYSFALLYGKGYIPVRPADFAKPYVRAQMHFDGENICTNYPICTVKAYLWEGQEKTCLRTALLSANDIRDGLARSFPVSRLALPETVPGQKLSVEVLVSTGELFTTLLPEG